MTNEQARKILCEYLAFDSEEHSEFLDAIRTLIVQADEVCDKDCEHCIYTECPKDDAQADGDLISRQSVIDAFYDMPNYTFSTLDVLTVLKQLPSVAIPTEHDGCHNCRWQSQSESEMPCKQCMRNYTDEWEREKPTDRDLMLDITESINDGNLKAYTEDGTLYLDDGNNRLAVPTAEPKTGHWIDADGDNAKCGCCNRLNLVYGTYCKHCGAKMFDSQERSE